MVALGFSGFPDARRTPGIHQQKEEIAMNGNDAATQLKDRFEEEAPQIANMDEIDFMTLLLESRIIQAS